MWKSKSARFGDYDNNYTEFERSTGFMRMVGTTTAWEDIYFPMTTGRIPGAAFPAWTAFRGNINAYTFAIGDSIDLAAREIYHKYKEGTHLYFHVHWATNGVDVVDTAVNFQIDYSLANATYDLTGTTYQFPAATTLTTGDITIPANTATHTHVWSGAGQVSGTNILMGGTMVIWFSRIAAVGVLPDPTSDPFVNMVGLHIETDTIGSRRELAK
jgi:hypothetical protein